MFRRLILLVVAIVVAWQAGRAFLLSAGTLLRNRPRRIGNWFREQGPTHGETYRDQQRYEIERERAIEEGWVVSAEERLSSGEMYVQYQRVAPPFGASTMGEGAN